MSQEQYGNSFRIHAAISGGAAVRLLKNASPAELRKNLTFSHVRQLALQVSPPYEQRAVIH